MPKIINWVVGKPIEHSQSPRLHNAIYQQLGIEAELITKEYSEAAPLIEGIRKNNILLTAVTMPLKETLLPYMDELDKTARETGVINTVIQHQGKLLGFNTDVDGLKHSLNEIALNNISVLIIGAGGVANLVGYYLKPYTTQLYWYNRTPNKAALLCDRYAGRVVTTENLVSIRDKIQLVINTTPVGMAHCPGAPIPLHFLLPHMTILDVIYRPEQTTLLQHAKVIGAHTRSGVDWFYHQALHQVQLWVQLIQHLSP